MGRRRFRTWNPKGLQSLLNAFQMFHKTFVGFFHPLKLIRLPGDNRIKGAQGILEIGQTYFQFCDSLVLCHEASIFE